MDDRETMELLRLLHKYVTEYAPDIPQTISALAADLGMSMDLTTDEADRLSCEIVNTIGVT